MVPNTTCAFNRYKSNITTPHPMSSIQEGYLQKKKQCCITKKLVSQIKDAITLVGSRLFQISIALH